MVNTLLASSAVDCGFKPPSDKTKNYKIGLVQSGYHIDLIVYDFFLSWYSWKTAVVVLNNNYSVTFSLGFASSYLLLASSMTFSAHI